LRNVWKALAAVLAVPAALGLVIGLVCLLELAGWGQRTHPADRELVALFNARRADFERLREMILADRDLLRVTERDTWPEDHESVGVSSERIAEYRRLLRVLALRSVEISPDGTAVEFVASSTGVVTHGSVKGYVFDPTPDPRLVTEDLDRMSVAGTGAGIRPMDGAWYLFFDGA
jgi:hypothetical protein